jgi:hypothetical protein
MNTNLIHNILNLAIVIVGALAVQDVWVGIVGPVLALKIVTVLTGVKLVMNAIRDGIKGMVKNQPPVE